MKRKIYNKLVEWKNSSQGKSALLINGARRVGKSYLCVQFAKAEYKSYILIDFGNLAKEIVDLFENESTNLDLFFQKLSAYYGVALHVRDSLMIFDEIQRYPHARQLIKYFVQDGRYDYIETGSLLSLKRNVQDIILPSEEKHIQLYPFDFEEFLWALGDTTTVPFIKTCFDQLQPLGQALHRKVLNDFRQYILVGGMPQAVSEYANTKDFSKVDEIKKDILRLYRNDMSKYASGYENKVISIFDDIPGQLSKKEKKYKLSSIRKQGRMRDYEDAFMWLQDAMVVNTCLNSTDPNVGLSLHSDYLTRKCYMADTGLLISLTFMDNDFIGNELYKAVLFDNIDINEGMLMENVVAQMLRTNGHRLFFYSRVDKNERKNNIEIDFVISDSKKIHPIEVKSSNYKRHSSLDKFKQRFKSRIGKSYILYQKDVCVQDEIVHLPMYMAMFL